MSGAPHPALVPLLNKCTPPSRVIAHSVPTRILRILQVDEAGCTFRVEQLIEHGGFGTPEPKGEWKTLSTHANKIAGAAIGVAFEALWKAQKDLVYKLRKRMMAQFPTVSGTIKPNGAT